jgi:D-3-phosphoglycerate dehydrogenase / 2-oxoglutarate reductase
MVAEQLRDFLENGNIRNSVNFPEAIMPPVSGATRLCIANANVPNMVGQITTALAKHNLNIADLLNKSRGDIAYTLVDVDGAIPGELCKEISSIHGVLSVRSLSNGAK